jgi:hypothetical protein
MIWFSLENKKSGNTMLAEKAKGQDMAMPETAMPEMVNPGRIIAQQERDMPLERQFHRDTKELPQQCQAGMMRPIRFQRERVTTGVLLETVWEIDSYRNKMHAISWIGFTCQR